MAKVQKSSIARGDRAQPGRRRRGAPSLSALDWADAALLEIGRTGIEGLAVEALAERLGVTKGSFYWHFKDRRALLAAALTRWEQRGTEDVISALEPEPDPRARMRSLLAVALGEKLHIEVAILAGSEDPIAKPIVRRVVKRRLEYLIGLYAQMGHDPAAARAFGIHALSAYLGVQHIIRTAPGYLTSQARAQYTEHLIATLVPS